MRIELHALVQWQDATRVARVDRVLRVDVSGYVMLIDIDDARAYPRIELRQELEEAIALGEAILLEHDPYQHLRVRDDALKRQYLQKQAKRSWDANKRRRDQHWSVIAPIIAALEDVLFDSKLLGPLVQQAHERSHCSKTHVYAYLRAYWQGGECKNALLPRYDRCGAKGKARPVGTAKRGRPRKAVQIADLPPGINIDDRVKEYFRRGTRLYYNTQDKRSASRTLKEIKKRFFNVGFTSVDGHRTPVLPPDEQLPTLRQYRYWLAHDWDPVASSIGREGPRRHNLRHRAKLGSLRSSQQLPCPGLQFQIDATVGDLYLVSEIEREIIGRPVIYLITDVFSTLIAGFGVGLEGPSWVGAMLALENMTLPKAAFCAEYGLTIDPNDWPSQSFPRGLCGDRGELLSAFADNLVSAFNLRISNTAAYRADWKGLIEREFGLLNEVCLKWIPGHTNGWHERGERDCRLDACMSLREFRRYLIDFILEYNTTHKVSDGTLDRAMLLDHVEPYPRDLWLWGIENRSGVLRSEPRDVVRRNLLPHGEALVSDEGLKFRRLHYTCTRADEEQWFERAAAQHRSWHVPILYDPRTTARLYLVLNDGAHLEECWLTERDQAFALCEWSDLEHHRALRLVADQQRAHTEHQQQAHHEARRQDWVREAQQKTQAAQAARGPESNASHVRGIRERRQLENARDREEHTWHLASDVPTAPRDSSGAGTADADDQTATQLGDADAAYAADTIRMLRQAHRTEDDHADDA